MTYVWQDINWIIADYLAHCLSPGIRGQHPGRLRELPMRLLPRDHGWKAGQADYRALRVIECSRESCQFCLVIFGPESA